MGRTLADGYLELRLDSSKLDPELRAALKKVPFTAHGQQAGKQMGDGFAKGFSDKGNAFTRVASTAIAKISLLGAVAAAATPGLIQLGAAVAPAGGAIAGLPIAIAGASAAMATFKVATAGVGDAVKKGLIEGPDAAARELAKLAPAAREAAVAIIAIKPATDALRQAVAQRFFKPFSDDVKPLVNDLLPVLKSRMGDLAGSLGGIGEEFLTTARKAGSIKAIDAVFDQTTNATVRLRAGIGPLTAGFTALIQSTAPELPKMATGLANVSTQVGNYLTKASQSGRITEIYRNAVSTLKDLGAIAGNVGSILQSVFRAATANGNSLLGNLKALTGQAAAFLKSGEGSGALTSVFQTLGQFGAALRTSLGAVLPAIAQSIRALAPALGNLAPAFAQLVVAVAPLLPYFTKIAVEVLTRLTPAVAALAGFLARNSDVMKVLVTAVGGAFLAMKAFAFYTAASSAATTAWTVATKIAGAATKVWAGIQAAFNFILAANPIGIVVIAIGALVAAVVIAYKNSETFRNVVDKTWQVIKGAIVGTWNGYIKPTLAALVAFFQNNVMPVIRFLYDNVVKPVFNAVGRAIQAAWAVIQVVFKLLVLYLKNVLFPTIKFLYDNVVKPVFSAIGTAIKFAYNNVIKPQFDLLKSAFSAVGTALKAVWEKVIRPLFLALGDFIKTKVLPGFQAGVSGIKTAWEKVKEIARKPVEFVVNKVINPLIGGFNRVAGAVGTDKIDPISGFESGGKIPGAPSNTDNRLASIADTGKLIKVATGEFITNTRSTTANHGLLAAINAKRGRVSRDDVDPFLDGYASGGRIGDGIGDFFGKVYRGIKGAASFVTDPKSALTKVANAALSRIPGGGVLQDVVKGMGSKLISGIGSFLSKQGGGGDVGGGSVYGGWRGMQRLIAGRFPGLGLISGFRAGSRTLSGNRSYHASGRAVDYPAVRALASWIRSNFGKNTKELITPWQDLNLHNGSPHTYTGAIWNQHNFAGGNAHVHWAAQNGGRVPKFDNGGTLAPGINTVYNGLGKPEALRRVDAGGGDVHIHFHDSVVTSRKQAEDLVVQAYTSAKSKKRI